jgi:hypothetical protein
MKPTLATLKRKPKTDNTPMPKDKPYAPQAHPMQHRLDAFRTIPSLVTPNPHFTPRGK